MSDFTTQCCSILQPYQNWRTWQNKPTIVQAQNNSWTFQELLLSRIYYELAQTQKDFKHVQKFLWSGIKTSNKATYTVLECWWFQI